MAIKKVGKDKDKETPQEVVKEQNIEQNLDDILKTFESNNENTIRLEDDDNGPAFPDPPEVEQQHDMSLHPPEFYENLAGGFAPKNEVTVSKSGFTAKETKKHLDDLAGKTIKRLGDGVRPAEEIDLANLDESMIMDMPSIKATAFKIIDILDPKPKDKVIRFRWANYKNFVGGNLGKYLAIGFQVASIDDIDQKRTPIDPSMVDGTQIKWYDVLLLKINVIRLMELYKTNIIKSVSKLEKAKVKGLAEAGRQFQSDISAEPGAARAYNQYRQALGKEPVEFFATE